MRQELRVLWQLYVLMSGRVDVRLCQMWFFSLSGPPHWKPAETKPIRPRITRISRRHLQYNTIY